MLLHFVELKICFLRFSLSLFTVLVLELAPPSSSPRAGDLSRASRDDRSLVLCSLAASLVVSCRLALSFVAFPLLSRRFSLFLSFRLSSSRQSLAARISPAQPGSRGQLQSSRAESTGIAASKSQFAESRRPRGSSCRTSFLLFSSPRLVVSSSGRRLRADSTSPSQIGSEARSTTRRHVATAATTAAENEEGEFID